GAADAWRAAGALGDRQHLRLRERADLRVRRAGRGHRAGDGAGLRGGAGAGVPSAWPGMKPVLGVARLVALPPMLVLSLAPIVWIAVTALKPGDETLAAGNPWWPDHPTLGNFGQLFVNPQFGNWVLNTAVVIGGTILIGVLASLLAGYALAYLDVPYGRSIVLVFFASYLLPQA